MAAVDRKELRNNNYWKLTTINQSWLSKAPTSGVKVKVFVKGISLKNI